MNQPPAKRIRGVKLPSMMFDAFFVLRDLVASVKTRRMRRATRAFAFRIWCGSVTPGKANFVFGVQVRMNVIPGWAVWSERAHSVPFSRGCILGIVLRCKNFFALRRAALHHLNDCILQGIAA